MDTRKQTLIATLDRFIRQRPGLEFGNYGDVTSYRSEVRSIGKDLQHARVLLRAVEWRDSISADDILRAARGAFSGRLSIVETESGKFTLDYCTGQYWPTEYRRAVCAVLSSALWGYWREHCMPEPTLHHNGETGETVSRYCGLRAGDYLRRTALREFGRGIAARWFN